MYIGYLPNASEIWFAYVGPSHEYLELICYLLVVQVDIRPEWAVLEQIPLSSLSKLSYEVGEPEDMYVF
jgi:hypothetical protein